MKDDMTFWIVAYGECPKQTANDGLAHSIGIHFSNLESRGTSDSRSRALSCMALTCLEVLKTT